jgi:carbon monoxide dehydrogenase subunit G
MELENTFVVGAPPDQAWTLLNDVPRVVPCLPGAALTEVVSDDAWKATLAVRLGPISLNFNVDVERERMDEPGRLVVLRAKARELRGRGGAEATLRSSLAEADGGTRVSIVTDLTLRGVVAQYGRGVVADVASQLTDEFAACIASRLRGEHSGAAANPDSTQPVGGGRLVFSALLRSLARRLRLRPR